jgi:hypothetical protein
VVAETHDAREAQRPVAREHHVVGFLHDLARDEDRILHALQRGHGAGAIVGLSITHASSSQKPSMLRQAPVPALKIGIVLERDHRRADRVERAAPALRISRPAATAARMPAVARRRFRAPAARARHARSARLLMQRGCAADVQLAQLLLGDGARAVDHEVLPALRLRECDHVADLVDAAHERTMRSSPNAMPPWGGAP